MFEMTDDEFEAAVQEALDRMPREFMDALENIAIFIADEPEEEDLEALDDLAYPAGTTHGNELLGYYDGISLPERAGGYDMDVPDTIFIFKGPHERTFDSREEVIEEVGKTVIHEIGHYFGLDDDRLEEMGY